MCLKVCEVEEGGVAEVKRWKGLASKRMEKVSRGGGVGCGEGKLGKVFECFILWTEVKREGRQTAYVETTISTPYSSKFQPTRTACARRPRDSPPLTRALTRCGNFIPRGNASSRFCDVLEPSVLRNR